MVKILAVVGVICGMLGQAQASIWDKVLKEKENALYTSGYSGVLLGQHGATTQEHFDLWLISTGYRQRLGDGWSWFVEAGSALAGQQSVAGHTLGSGVRYKLLPSLTVGGQLRQLNLGSTHTELQLSGSLLLPSSFSLQADLGVSHESSLTLGIGYQF